MAKIISGIVLFFLFACGSTVFSQSINSDNNVNVYKGIPVEVTGIPYNFDDIRGNFTMDYYIEYAYNMFTTGQYSAFVNFRINKFIFNFQTNGSLTLKTIYSYDRTPAGGNSFYPAQTNTAHDWRIQPQYHQHSRGNCSLDRLDDIAVSQAKLNEMIQDPSLKSVYDILLSVAQDMDYDYTRVGVRASFVTPRPLTGVCDDYADLLISRLHNANINGVSGITKVSGQNHAWVTLDYNGRLLYLDATWFDGNNIDDNGVVVNIPDKDPRNMTFDNVIFTNHGKHHLPGR